MDIALPDTPHFPGTLLPLPESISQVEQKGFPPSFLEQRDHDTLIQLRVLGFSGLTAARITKDKHFK